jgi:type IV pilus assembly protein PilB
MRRGPRLAEILLQAGLAKEDDLRRARQAAQERGGSLAFHLVSEGGVDEAELVRVVGRALRMPTVSLRGKRVDPEVLRLVPAELAESYGCVPLFVKEEGGSRALYLGIEDPTDQAVADDVSFRVGLRVRTVVVGPLELRQALGGAAPAPARVDPRASTLVEQMLPPRDTEPVLAEPGAAGAPAAAEEAPPPGEAAAGKPRDVPTRDILRALTKLLLEKEIFSRAELLEAVRAVRETEAPSGDA